MRIRLALLAIGLATFPALAHSRDAERPLNILFLGNSLTQVADIPGAFHDLAVASGRPGPHIGRQIRWGRPLSAHVAQFKEEGMEKDVVARAIEEGEHWDFVVLQEYTNDNPSIEKDSDGKIKWPGTSVADATTLVERVRDHSPEARAVLYERWAPVGGNKENGLYKRDLTEAELAGFAKTLAGYRKVNRLAVEALNAKFGKGTARMAPVGEGFDAYGYQGLFGDGLHQDKHGALLAAMVMYMTMYDQKDLSKVDAAAFLGRAWNEKQELTAEDFATLAAAAVKAMADPGLLTARI